MNMEEMPVLVVEGGPRQRGRACGEALRQRISACLDAIDTAGERERGISANEFRARFLAETSFGEAVARWTPDLLEEVRGLAEGANQPFERMFFTQLMDEEWIYVRNRIYESGKDAGHCSCFGARRPDNTIVAQNMDLGDWLDGHQVVIRHIDAKAGFDIQVLTFAGYLGLCGMSRRGPAVCCNSLLELDFSANGIPVAFVFRSLVQASTATDAARLCHKFPHASGQNYVIGGRDLVTSLECSANRVVPFQPSPDRVYHTNHTLVSDDSGYVDRYLPDGTVGERCRSPSSPARLASLLARVGNPAFEIDVAAAKEALRAKDDPRSPVCRDGGDGPDAQIGFTFGSIICEMSDDSTLHVAPGPPCRTPYRSLDFQTPVKR